MTELYPPDATLHARSGAVDAEQEVYYPPIGESPYYTSFYKMLHRLLDVVRRAGDLRVYKDGPLTFGVRAGEFLDGPTVRTFAGLVEQDLADNAANYIYLAADATLVVNQTGFPSPAVTPHHALAVIVTSGGEYLHEDITDCRGRSLWKLASAMTAAQADELVSGSATALHTHGLAGLADAVKDRLPKLSITHDSEGTTAANTIRVSLQVQNADGQALSGRFRIRLWLATTDFGPRSATGNAVAVYAGATLEARLANADYDLITSASGQAAIDITISEAATRYLMAETDGAIYSSGALNWSA